MNQELENNRKRIGGFTIYAGISFRGKIRHALNECKFRGMNIIFLEEKSLFESKFLVTGEESDLRIILNNLRKYEDN
jgi:hypothetical protein